MSFSKLVLAKIGVKSQQKTSGCVGMCQVIKGYPFGPTKGSPFFGWRHFGISHFIPFVSNNTPILSWILGKKTTHIDVRKPRFSHSETDLDMVGFPHLCKRLLDLNHYTKNAFHQWIWFNGRIDRPHSSDSKEEDSIHRPPSPPSSSHAASWAWPEKKRCVFIFCWATLCLIAEKIVHMI